MEVTEKIKHKIYYGGLTKFDLAIKLGISRVTLDTRLDKSNWKKGELSLLKTIV